MQNPHLILLLIVLQILNCAIIVIALQAGKAKLTVGSFGNRVATHAVSKGIAAGTSGAGKFIDTKLGRKAISYGVDKGGSATFRVWQSAVIILTVGLVVIEGFLYHSLLSNNRAKTVAGAYTALYLGKNKGNELQKTLSGDDGDKKKDDQQDKKNDGGGGTGGSAPVKGDTSVPEGIDEGDWNKASDLQKQIAKTAYVAATMKFPKAGNPSDANPAGGLRYEQGNTPIGVYDCSTFVSGVLEANGLRSDGGKRDGEPYNFETMKKADLVNYEFTGAELTSWERGNGFTGTFNGDTSGMTPGDIIVDSEHVAIYVGKNKAGKGVFAHASSPGNHYIFWDADSKNATYDVGLNDAAAMATFMSGSKIMHPDKYYNRH